MGGLRRDGYVRHCSCVYTPDSASFCVSKLGLNTRASGATNLNPVENHHMRQRVSSHPKILPSTMSVASQINIASTLSPLEHLENNSRPCTTAGQNSSSPLTGDLTLRGAKSVARKLVVLGTEGLNTQTCPGTGFVSALRVRLECVCNRDHVGTLL